MATPQAGIFALGTRTHHHLEFDVRPGADPVEVIDATARLREPHVTSGGSNLVIGFGPDLWRRLSATPPPDLGAFELVSGVAGNVAPRTQHDVWIWIHGTGRDVVLDAAVQAEAAIASVADLVEETACFVYHDSRDLTGFIDGTENPPPTEAREVACIEDGRPGAGGSHVIAQRWVHDLRAFGALDESDQERVFGRSKADSVAIPRDVRPVDAHIRRAELLDVDGAERPIYRRSTPYGNVRERGLYFLGFSAERERFDGMLAQMYGTSGDGIHDRLLDFTTAVTGSYYFAPSIEDLTSIGFAESA